MLQNGVLPRFMANEPEEIFTSMSPPPCMLSLHQGLNELGTYQVFTVMTFNALALQATLLLRHNRINTPVCSNSSHFINSRKQLGVMNNYGLMTIIHV